jgi:transposase-like protein
VDLHLHGLVVAEKAVSASAKAKTVRVTLSCPVCRGRNLVPAKVESNIPQSFECLECQTQFSILKPEIAGYVLTAEKKMGRGEKLKKGLAEWIYIFMAWWLLRKR